MDLSRGTRSNLILNEVTGLGGASVTVRLYEAGNRTSPIAEKEVFIEAGDTRNALLTPAGGQPATGSGVRIWR